MAELPPMPEDVLEHVLEVMREAAALAEVAGVDLDPEDLESPEWTVVQRRATERLRLEARLGDERARQAARAFVQSTYEGDFAELAAQLEADGLGEAGG